MTILVTGGAGYIGSHTTYGLLDRGEHVVVLDNLSGGLRSQVDPKVEFVIGNVGDQELVLELLKNHAIESVIHFAASIVVPESVADPLSYYQNNTGASRSLIECCVESGVKHFIFSSTAAVYGAPDCNPIPEDGALAPINPYGRSKLMTEWMLEDAARAFDIRYIALRYFNVAGADPQGRTGQSSPEASHLIKRACQASLGRIEHLEVFGTDYPTPDGTGVRDYIHVTDLVNAHLVALDALRAGSASGVYNAGYGRGFSVRDVVAALAHETGRPVPVRHAPRRPGDPPILVADSTRLRQVLGWQPQHDNLAEIVHSAYLWERRLNG